MVSRRILLLLTLVAISGAFAHPARGLERDDVLLVGDSVTAGVWYLSISQESAAQSWAGQLVQRLGLPVDDIRLEGFYPLDHKSLTEEGLGFLSLRYPWHALPVLFPQHSRFSVEDERVIFAVPGQMAQELLTQSNRDPGRGSAGWTFGRLFLPEGFSAIETIEHWQKRPRWIALFIGANDALASLGIVGRSHSPSPEAFAASYDELVRRLGARLAPGVPKDHVLLLTIPDVTELPLLQPAEDGVDEHGRPLPPGSEVSAFLKPYRNRYREQEVWTKERREALWQLIEHYNEGIERAAEAHGATIVEMRTLFAELREDPSFDAVDSPYFSPDLHHPSHKTHTAIAERVWQAMERLEPEPLPDHAVVFDPLPTNADYDEDEMERVYALTRLALLGLSEGPLPPDPTARLAMEWGGQAGQARLGHAAVSFLLGVESTPSPSTTRWLSRGTLQGRVTVAAVDFEASDTEVVPKAGLLLRAGAAFEPIGAYSWTRIGVGAQVAGKGGAGWYLRGEWRLLYADVSSRGWAPDLFEAGLRLGWLYGRVGVIGD